MAAPAGEDSRPGPARVVALAGGVGAARFLRGLVRVLDPTTVTVVVNTADDVVRHGLMVSPDIDSVVYGLAGRSDEQRGWGLRDETWHCLEELRALGADPWFQLGDRDLATHVWRTERRRRGEPLSAVTAAQCRALGVGVRVLPMSDDGVTTMVRCEGHGELHLQEYLVRERCEPRVEAVRLAGVERARPAPGVLEAIAGCDAVVVCPSNPVISVGPILAVAGVREALRAVPQGAAVTPIVGGRAVKGPAAEMLRAEGVAVSASGVASLYADFCQVMVVDGRDPDEASRVEALGMRPVLAETMMTDVDAATSLAATVCDALGLRDRVAAA